MTAIPGLMAVLFMAGCDLWGGAACGSDLDCKDDRICEDGECTSESSAESDGGSDIPNAATVYCDGDWDCLPPEWVCVETWNSYDGHVDDWNRCMVTCSSSSDCEDGYCCAQIGSPYICFDYDTLDGWYEATAGDMPKVCMSIETMAGDCCI